MSEGKYRFTDENGLLILDDSPMDAKQGKAYLDFLEEYAEREEERLKKLEVLEAQN